MFVNVTASQVWELFPESIQSSPQKLYIFQHTISFTPYKKKWNRFHKNVPRVFGNKDYIVV